jgi:hypothetical protein
MKRIYFPFALTQSSDLKFMVAVNGRQNSLRKSELIRLGASAAASGKPASSAASDIFTTSPVLLMLQLQYARKAFKVSNGGASMGSIWHLASDGPPFINSAASFSA